METQPQLLLLQKTMLVAEGVGRTLDPTVNMWALAQPLIEEWMRENRGVEARLADAAINLIDTIERLPTLVRNFERVVSDMAEEGLRLETETASGARARGRRSVAWLELPLWLAALALLAIAAAMW